MISSADLKRNILLLLAPLSLCGATAFLSRKRFSSLLDSNLGDSIASKPGECSFNHSGLDAILKKHVKQATVVNGINSTLFDYEAILASDADAATLTKYIHSLAAFDPSCLTLNGKLAFWINVYNAVIINLVCSDAQAAGNKLPASIQDLDGNASVVWDRKACIVNGKSMTLEEVLDKASHLKDPRIHAAVNCASLSCPDLRGEAYSTEHIQEELDMQVKAWLSNPTKGVQIVRNKLNASIRVSPVFHWHDKDFISLPSFLDDFSDEPLGSMEVSGYLPYDWNLNRFR